MYFDICAIFSLVSLALHLKTLKISIIKNTKCYINLNFIILSPVVAIGTHDNNKI